MNELGTEALLRLGKVVLATLIGVVVYLVLVGPLGVAGSAQLALEAWIAGALVIVLVETSAF
jgi:hypothetical protein